MSSSRSGKDQKAIRSCSWSGTGGWKVSTSSKGIDRATSCAANSVSESTLGSVKQNMKTR